MSFISQTIRNMRPYIWGEQPKLTASVIKLNTNENPYPPHVSVKRKLEKFAYQGLRYYPDPLCHRLIEQIASTYKVKPANVVIGNGSDELIALVFKLFFNRYDSVLFTEFTYSHYRTYAESSGVTASTMPMKNFQVDLGMLDKFRSKVFFLANPNVPTGTAIDPHAIEFYLKRHPTKLFVIDEAYVDFCDKSCVQFIKEYDNLLILRTASKAFSLCGIRLGYALASPRIIEGFYKVKDPYNVNALSQAIGLEVFKNLAYYKKNIRKIIETRKMFKKKVEALEFEVLPSDANFLFMRHKDVVAEDLYAFLKKKKIFVRYFDKKDLRNFLRISIGLPKEMKLLAYWIEKYLNIPRRPKPRFFLE